VLPELPLPEAEVLVLVFEAMYLILLWLKRRKRKIIGSTSVIINVMNI
jgi:hypothetical protein